MAITPQIIMRELTAEDITALYKMCKDPAISEYIYDMDKSLEEEIAKHKAYIQQVYHFYQYGLWGVFLKESNKLIGRCGIQNFSNGIEMWYLISSDYQHNGYALERINSIQKYCKLQLALFYCVLFIAKAKCN